jgi:hypothetical protein
MSPSAGLPDTRTKLLRRLFVTVLYGLTSAVILFLFVNYEGISHRNSTTSEFGATVYGTAHKPSVYRVLVPLLIRGVTSVTPDSLKTKVQRFVEARKSSVESLGWEEKYYVEYFAACVIMLFLFIGYAFAFRYLLSFYYARDSAVANLVPVFGLLLLPLFFRYHHFLYDPATLCLFTLSLALIAHRKNLWYYPVFLLACLNKETAILLLGIFFLFQRGHMPFRVLVRHLGVQGMIWTLVRAALYRTFENNAGSPVEFQLVNHNRLLLEDPRALTYFVLVVVLFALFIAQNWKDKPLLLRQGFLTLLIPLLSLSVLWGFFDALRVYYEALPFAVMLALPTVLQIFNVDHRNASRS